jgi:hypothetical protein
VQNCKGKGIVLSLEARDWSECRGPMDLINLGVLCGMSEEEAIDSVCKNVYKLLERSELRSKYYKSAVCAEIDDQSGKMETAFENIPETDEKMKKKKKKKKKNKKKKKKSETEAADHSKVKKAKHEPLNFYK